MSATTSATHEQETGAPAIVKPVDAWWTVLFVDPLAVRIVPRMVGWSWVTPNRLTAVAALLGIASGACFLAGALVVGGVLFQVRFFCDCLDGKLARARRLSSARGAAFDLGVDVVTISWNYAALALFVVREGAAGPELVAAILAFSLAWAWMILYRKGLPDPPTRAAPDPGRSPPAGGASGTALTRRPGVARRYVNAMARRRLMPTPYGVEAEVVALSLVPLFGSAPAAAVGLWGATAFYVAAVAVNAARIWRRASALDRAQLAASRTSGRADP